MDDDARALVEDLDACAVACEEAFQRLRAERGAVGLGPLERDLLLISAVARTACGETAASRFEDHALTQLFQLAAELGKRIARELAETRDEGLAACREACLAAAASARRLASQTLSNGYG
jgi:hypothetical protein